MATREELKLTQAERQRIILSEEFKRQKVKEIDQKVSTITQVYKAYQVREKTFANG